MKIAILSCYHVESSLCLSKALAANNNVDYYLIGDYLRGTGKIPGIDYSKVKKHLGIHPISTDDIPELKAYLSSKKLNMFAFNFFSFSTKLNWINYPLLFSSIRLLSSKGYDVINIVGQTPQALILHRLLKKQHIVHTVHEIGSHLNNKFGTPFVYELIRDRSNIIFHSKYLCKKFNSIPGSHNCNTTVIPFGKFETLLYYNDNKELIVNPCSHPTLLFYGFISSYKGLDVLSAAHRLLKNRGVSYRLIIAGAGSDSNLKYFNSQQNCIVINRFLSNSEIIQLHKVSDVVVIPYRSASQSGIIPTSFMLGKTVIATEVGALPEVIDRNKNGLVIPPNDPMSLADAMYMLISDKSLLENLCDNAKKFGTNDDFDWLSIADKTIVFYGTC